MESIYMCHYTTLKSFLKIWESKTLKFSLPSRLNDINEVSKFYFGEHKPMGWTNTTKLEKEVKLYKQISLTKETNMYSSCMIPAMWGHYGNNGKGVCIRIDISKVKPSQKVFRGKVKYVKRIEPVTYDKSDLTKFISMNRGILFFKKTKDWSPEIEYRLVSKEEGFLDISNAISEVIITSNFGGNGFSGKLFKDTLKPLVTDVKILEFCPNGLNGFSLRDEDGNQIYPRPKEEVEVILDDKLLNQHDRL